MSSAERLTGLAGKIHLLAAHIDISTPGLVDYVPAYIESTPTPEEHVCEAAWVSYYYREA